MKSTKDPVLLRSGLAKTKDYTNFKQIYDPALFRQIQEDSEKQKRSEDFQNFLLMRKGLNKDYEEEYKINRFSQEFERRTHNPRMQHNKNQIMKQLMISFTNKSFLSQLKKSNQEISE